MLVHQMRIMRRALMEEAEPHAPPRPLDALEDRLICAREGASLELMRCCNLGDGRPGVAVG